MGVEEVEEVEGAVMPANALMQPRIDGTMRATPRNALLGYIADALNAANNYANKPNPAMPMGKANPPLSLLANALGVGDLGATADNLSYGRNLTQGQGMARQMLPETANALLTAGPLAAKFPKQAAAVTAGLLSGDTAAARAAMVWHGSPHKFDKFDSSKIGTGEGAQAYGHGLYLAESPEVGGQYARMNLTGPANVAHVAGRDGGDAMAALKRVYPGMPSQWYESAIRKSADAGNLYKVDLPDSAISRMLDWDKPLSQQAPEVQQALQSMVGDVAGSPNAQRASRDIGRAFNPYNRADLLDEISKRYGWKVQGDTLVKPDGSVIPESAIQNQLQQRQRGKVYDTAGDLYRDLAQVQGSDASISAVLRQQGVPGVRYLDGGSRGAGVGSSNFVVFPGEENILQILERNGVPLK